MENPQKKPVTKYQEAFKILALKNNNPTAVHEEIDKIIQENFDRNNNIEVWKTIYSCIDLTTLTAKDTKTSVTEMVKGVNDRFKNNSSQLPPVAAICVYPALVNTVKQTLNVPSVHIAAVSGGFPASQTLLDVKVAETSLTILEGANEIDIVLNLGAFLEGDYDTVTQEIEEQVAHAKGAILKVILETGALEDLEQINQAAVLSLYSGAQFLKTSTGKEYPGATFEAVYVMAHAIKKYYELYNKKVGLKISGGVSSPEVAVKYYTLVEAILGKEWLNSTLFRIGTSSLEGKLRNVIMA